LKKRSEESRIKGGKEGGTSRYNLDRLNGLNLGGKGENYYGKRTRGIKYDWCRVLGVIQEKKKPKGDGMIKKNERLVRTRKE